MMASFDEQLDDLDWNDEQAVVRFFTEAMVADAWSRELGEMSYMVADMKGVEFERVRDMVLRAEQLAQAER